MVAQVGALIDMANRLRKQRESFTSEGPISAPGAAFTGDIAQMSVATVLTLLELERRSGHLKVRSDSGQVALLRAGRAACWPAQRSTTTCSSPRAVLRETLRWKKGSFTFRSAEVAQLSGARQTIGGLLIEAMRLEDEARR